MMTPAKVHFFPLSFLAWAFILPKVFGQLSCLSTLIWLSRQFNAINLTSIMSFIFKKIPLFKKYEVSFTNIKTF